MNPFDNVNALFSKLKVTEPEKLHRLVYKDIPQMPWYTRLDMALSLALQVKELHKSGRFHGDITLSSVYLNRQQKAFLKPPATNNTDISQVPNDILLLGCTIYELLYYKRAPWRTRPYKTDELDLVQKMLGEYELLSDDDALGFVIQWMCHPDPDKRFSIDTSITWLRRISEENHDAALFCFTPPHIPTIPANLVDRKPDEIADIVQQLFTGCVQNGYISRKTLKLNHKIFYLKDLIILLPKKSKDEDHHVMGTFKHGRPVKIVQKIDGRWQDAALYALSSRKSESTYTYKSVARKERAMRALFKETRVLARCMITLSFSSKPDKLLCLYEQAVDLFTKLENKELEDPVATSYKIIKALDTLQKAGIIHRDVKPENILITPDDEVLLCDMDDAVKDIIWKHYSEQVGSEPFFAPERHAQNCKGSWEPQEIYSLGCLLLLILELKVLPWETLNGYRVIDKKLSLKVKAEEEKAKLDKEQPLDKKSALISLAYWMIHPAPDKRPTWNEIILKTQVRDTPSDQEFDSE